MKDSGVGYAIGLVPEVLEWRYLELQVLPVPLRLPKPLRSNRRRRHKRRTGGDLLDKALLRVSRQAQGRAVQPRLSLQTSQRRTHITTRRGRGTTVRPLPVLVQEVGTDHHPRLVVLP